MRVISGKNRGLKLDSEGHKALRPMLDRVKEALFNILQGRLEGTVVLDLFSGSGALGIEALSRGAAYCTFVEQDAALVRLIERNLAKCRIDKEKVRIIGNSVHALPQMTPGGPARRAEIVLVDPPYDMVSDQDTRKELFDLLEGIRSDWIDDAALIVLHHAPDPNANWPTETFRRCDSRIYGRSELSFFKTAD